MRKLWESRSKLVPVAGFLPAVVLAACIGTALHGYSAPELSVSLDANPTDATESEADKTNTDKSNSSSKKTASAVSEKKSEDTPSVAAVSESGTYKDGTYTGTGTGFSGPITVQVVIEGGKITDITILSSTDDSPYLENASALLKQIISLQSTNVDTVSGATYSSVGLINAVRNALQKAGGSSENDTALPTLSASGSGSQSSSSGEAPTVETVAETGAYKDGVYTGSGTGFSGPITVQVTVSGGKITDIQVLSTSDDQPYFNNAKALLQNIIATQSTNVDVVSGATYSSSGLITAVRDALQNAAVSPAVTQAGAAQQVASQKQTTATAATAAAAVTAAPEAKGNFPYPDGVYEGTGEGFRGETTIALTLKNGTISKLEVVSTDDDAPFFQKAEALLSLVIQKQSTQVDAVSGATFSSEGILEAIEDALNVAKAAASNTDDKPATTTTVTAATTESQPTTVTPSSGSDSTTTETTTEPVPSLYADGEYVGTATCNPDEDEDFGPYTLSVRVKIENDTILEITELTGTGSDYDSSNDWYISRAGNGTSKKPGVVSQILGAQSTDGIDAVSGATCSSNAILEAVEDALRQAKEGV